MIAQPLQRDPAQPPSDALAEAVMLNHALLNPDMIGTVNLGPLLVFPEHRWCWQAMVRVRMGNPGLSFGHFYIAWQAELERAHPGRGWQLADLLSVAEAKSARAWAEYKLDRARHPDRPLMQTSYLHGFEWWLARLRAIAEARAVIAAAQEIAERAWRVPELAFTGGEALAILERVAMRRVSFADKVFTV